MVSYDALLLTFLIICVTMERWGLFPMHFRQFSIESLVWTRLFGGIGGRKILLRILLNSRNKLAKRQELKEVFMTKTKKNEAKKGESDKMVSDKYRQIGLIPLSAEAIPPVKVLQACGKANLQRLLVAVNNALQTDVAMCRECDGLCKASCHEKKLPTLEVLKKYLVNLQVAFRRAEDDFPLLPDLRTRDWFEANDKFVAFSVWDRAGDSKHLDRTIALNPTLESCTGRNDDATFEVQFDINDPNCPEWSAHGSSKFDLHSPYIMTGNEETFFIAHPGALQLWLSMCGNLYPEYIVYGDVKELFARKISELGADAVAV